MAEEKIICTMFGLANAFPYSPFAVLLGTVDLAFLFFGLHFLVSEILRIRRAEKFPAGTLEPWRAGKGEILCFAGAFLFILLVCPIFGFRIAGAVFPEIDLARNPVYAVGFYQPIALIFLLGLCIFQKPLSIAKAWNASGAKSMLSRISLFSRGNVWQFFGLLFLSVFVAGLLSQCVPLLFPSLKEAWAQNQILIDNLQSLEHPWILWIVIPTLVVFTPIVEEILFRAGIYRLLRNKMPGVPAAILTGFCFAILHDSLAGIFPLAVLSCVLCYAYEYTGKLAVPVILHGLFNLNTVLMIYTGIGA